MPDDFEQAAGRTELAGTTRSLDELTAPNGLGF